MNVFPDPMSRWQAWQQVFQVHPVGKKVFADLLTRVVPMPPSGPQYAGNHGHAAYMLAQLHCHEAIANQLLEPQEPAEVKESQDDGRDWE